MKDYWTSLASFLGVLAFLQTLLQILFPPHLRSAFIHLLHRLLLHSFSSHLYFDITEIDGVNTNELYHAVHLYLSSSAASSLSSTASTRRLSITRPLNSSSITFGLSNNDVILDTFKNVTVQWEHVVTQRQSQTFSWRPLPEEKRGFTLKIKKRYKSLILTSYLDHIMEKSNEIKRKNQERLLYTNSRGGSLDSSGHPWESVPFKHPSTFETLAIDPLKKLEIMKDLKEFANGQSFYQNTGRAWKRGYLLFGPPGTGKSSLIAAMANYLGYDIYDLELTEVHNNSELRKLLMKTSSKSIIVIEDIDCSINLTNRSNSGKTSNNVMNDCLVGDPEGGNKNTITLSGLLNFTDGLWSCCGSERIFVFTTNHVEKLDPALLRSGRMDMHVFMTFCGFESLKILLRNYLGCEVGELDDEVMMELEGVIEKAEMTPADVSEVLIKNRRSRDRAVRELLEDLKGRADRWNGGERKKKLEEEEEEQEKRALDSPNENEDDDEDECKHEFEESCKKGEEGDDK